MNIKKEIRNHTKKKLFKINNDIEAGINNDFNNIFI